MRWNHSYIMLVFGVLLFGCVNETTPEQPDQTFTCPDGSVVSTLDNCPPEEPPINLEGKGFDELVELGLPIECNVILKTDSGKFNYSLYIKGEKLKQVYLAYDQSSQLSRHTSIWRGDGYIYYKLESPYPAPESGITTEWVMLASSGGKCDSFKINESETEGLPDFMDEEKTYLDCVVVSFDDSFFETDWKSCTDEEFSEYVLGGNPIGENVTD